MAVGKYIFLNYGPKIVFKYYVMIYFYNCFCIDESF